MLEIIIEDEDDLIGDEEEIKFYKKLLKKLKKAEKAKLDPNHPIMFPSFNYDTYIVKKEDGYYIDTDFNIVWEDFLEGIDDFLEDESFNLDEKYFFYILPYDVIGKFTSVNSDNTPCKTGGHDPTYEGIELKDGRLVCLECEKDKLKDYEIIKED